MAKSTILIFALLFYGIKIYPNNFVLSGFAFDKNSREPLIGATITDKNSDKVCISNSMGYFSLQLDSGLHEISIGFIGYKTHVEELGISKDFELNVYLETLPFQLDTVSIDSKKNSESKTVQSGEINLPIHQIQSIPSILGENDPLKIAQMLPGIQSGGEATPGFFVRGSAADQNLVLIDDAPIYNPFHLFGIFSVINADALKTFEITKGGYSAEYGGRLASIVNINLKEGNKNKTKGYLNLGLASSKVLLELPITKNKSSIIISGRSSYAHLFAKPFLPKDQYGTYYFYDFSTKYTAELSAKTKLYFSGMFSADRFNLVDEYLPHSLYYARVKWNNTALSLRINHVISKKLFWKSAIIFSNYNLLSKAQQKNLDATYYLQYQSNIREIALKNDFTYYLNAYQQIQFGVTITRKNFVPDAVTSKNEDASLLNRTIQEYNAIESAIYFEDEFKLGKKLIGRIGGRVNVYSYKNKTTINPEPRISLAYQLAKSWAIKGTYTQMHQYLHLISTKGVGLPTDLWVPATNKVPYKMAKQYTVAVVKDFAKSFSISAEGYYKEIFNDISLKEGSSFMQIKSIDVVDKNDLTWEDNITTGTSWNYGSEVFIHKKKGRLQGWISYTLAWSISKFKELNFGNSFLNRQDRRHSLSIMMIYRINEKWSISADWVYMTGNHITLANSIYNNIDILPENSYLESHPNYVNYEFTGINNFKMPPYHRFDFGLSYKKQRKDLITEFDLSVYNVYNRQNPYFYYLVSSPDKSESKVINSMMKQVSVLPIIPSINCKISF
jgi:hypothetical protein